jgi:hypothetical protein
MARTKFSSPTLNLEITAEQREKAIASNSHGCLLADAIKKQYPEMTGVTVDMATIRVTDRKAGKRYTYLTPPIGQHMLLALDQGWPHPADRLVVKRAVKITPVTRGKKIRATKAAERDARKTELETKVMQGEELTRHEQGALTQLSNALLSPERPSTVGPVEVKVDSKGPGAIVHGGRPLPQGEAHPNLLRGRDRHFGAKLADPGQAFNEAVEAAVAERLAGTEEVPAE